MTPPAPQRTAFEKDGGANAGPVVNRVFSDVKDEAGQADPTNEKTTNGEEMDVRV